MIAAWMLYATVVGGLLGAAALAVERVLRSHGRPTRWLWAATLVLSAAWPVAQWGLDSRPSPATTAMVTERPNTAAFRPERTTRPIAVAPTTVSVGPESMLRRLDRPILALWALTTATLGSWFLWLVLRTRRLRRRWRSGSVGGRSVLISEDHGPAVVGVLRPEIVLPSWCRELDEATRRLVLDHEVEHVRARDPGLLVLMASLPVLLPWHPALWWQLDRLRTAVEGDCDLRVLRRHPGRTRSYIELLLDIGTRRSLPNALAAMLSEPYETLRRRIQIMTMPRPARPWLQGSVFAGVAAVLALLACAAPGPTDAKESEAGQPAASRAFHFPAVAGEDRIPTFTPYSVRPRLRNPDDVVAVLERGLAGLRADAEVPPTVDLWLFLDERPEVLDVRLRRSTGHRALDAAALEVARVADFTPALNRDQGRPVWVSLPIRFGTGEVGAHALETEAPSGAASEVGLLRDEPLPLAHGTPAATGRVEGVIRDAGSGRPLRDAQVFVRGTGRGTLSDAEGLFRIDHVPVGQRPVVAHLIGYGDVSARVSVEAHGSAPVDMELRETAVPVDGVVVRRGPGSGGS